MANQTMEKSEEMMREYTKMMLEMKARMNAMEAKDAARDNELKKLKKESEANKKKVKALEKDNKALKSDNATLKAKVDLSQGRRSVLDPPPSRSVVEYSKTGEMDGIEEFSFVITSLDPDIQLDYSRDALALLLKTHLDEPVKFTEKIVLRMVKGKLSENTPDDIPIESDAISIVSSADVGDAIKRSADSIKAKIDGYITRGSNWSVRSVESHEATLTRYNPLVGSSFIELPSALKSDMNGLINIENRDDDQCFRRCHVRHLEPKSKRASNITSSDRKTAAGLDYAGVSFPVKIDDIPKIERGNKIRITVIMLKGEKMFFPRYTSRANYEDHMELLLIENDDGNGHYVLIRDISMLFSCLHKTQHKKYYCLRCLNGFNSQGSLDDHSVTCREVNGTQRTVIPKRGSKVMFKNNRRQLPAQFVIYADFESLLIPVKEEGGCLRKT